MDPDTLETIGTYTFDGQTDEKTPFTAHPKFDPATGDMMVRRALALSSTHEPRSFYSILSLRLSATAQKATQRQT
jgi:carotenoid cleavage dioxygenase-like enzyme